MQVCSLVYFPDEISDGKENRGEKNEFDHEEYYIKSHFKSVKESLKLFADDDLVSEPGIL